MKSGKKVYCFPWIETKTVARRIGVFICECGPNIGEAMDLDVLGSFARSSPGVVSVKKAMILCDAAGRKRLEDDIRNLGLDCVVTAACSPKEHEKTFRESLVRAGLNPFKLCMANIREQCAWTSPNREAALAGAKAAVNAAIRRVRFQGPLSAPEAACLPDVLVIGAGVSGISAALTLANEGRKVRLVEKSPCIGGKAALCDSLFYDMQCASCLLDPVLDEVLHHENIEIFLLSRVVELLGFFGHFRATILQESRMVDMSRCVGCGACADACPVSTPDQFNRKLNNRPAAFIPYPEAVPHAALIDLKNCLRSNGGLCAECGNACPFDAVDFDRKDRELHIEAGAVVVATGFGFAESTEPVRGKPENVFTAMEFERMLVPTGPTEGQILLRDGKSPDSIALVHFGDSGGQTGREDFSGFCLALMVKYERQIRERLPGATVCHFHSNLCRPHKKAKTFFESLTDKDRSSWFRVVSTEDFSILGDGGQIRIMAKGVAGKFETLDVDMVVTAPVFKGGADSRRLARVLGIDCDEDGYCRMAGELMDPFVSKRKGIYPVGGCIWPKDVRNSVAEGQAAAGSILSALSADKPLELTAETAVIDPEICSGCAVCRSVCAYGAICRAEGGDVFEVNPVLCRGCGVCAAACPSGAVCALHYTDTQITEEIRGILE